MTGRVTALLVTTARENCGDWESLVITFYGVGTFIRTQKLGENSVVVAIQIIKISREHNCSSEPQNGRLPTGLDDNTRDNFTTSDPIYSRLFHSYCHST